MANKYVRIAVLAAVLITVLTIGVAWAVQLTIGTTGSVGGTGIAPVESGVSGDQIDYVWFLVDSTSLDVTAVNVTWTPTKDGNFLVGVVLYDDTSAILASGTATVTSATAGVTQKTIVSLSSSVDPSDIYGVEVVIVQQP